ncbi:MAG: hypothetical protein GC153_10075 [Alphaproteobacteria bacterium]|nr:hypothetical protein [Alphaproteobacteria bacterium]
MRKIIGGVAVSIAPPLGGEPAYLEPTPRNSGENLAPAGSLYDHLVLEARHASGRVSERMACLLDKWAASAHGMAARLSH